MEKIRVGISSCLLGEKVRYDGGHKLDHFLRDTLGQYFEWVGVCPEVECGLSIPREAMHLEGSPDTPRLVTVKSKKDLTGQMLRWSAKRLQELEKEDFCGFIFKSDSPSSGMKNVRLYDKNNVPRRIGTGLFAQAFMNHFPQIPVEDDGRLNDPEIRENFIERVFVFKRWKHFIQEDGSTPGLIEFHTRHKLLVMAHSPTLLNQLGKWVAQVKKSTLKETLQIYLSTLMEGLKIPASIKKNTNVLQHMMGYFKNSLSADEKQEMLETIGNYHDGYVPLIVPISLLQHYVRKHQEPFLKNQLYLNPHPTELMLRNHV